MRIIGISGLWCYQNPVWHNLALAFTKEYACEKFVVEEEPSCQPWEVGRLRAFSRRIARLYDDGTDTMLVGHSIGGVVACAIADAFTQSRIMGVVTIFSPHQFCGGVFTLALCTHAVVQAPIVSFSADHDELVWWGARHPQARAHIPVECDHWMNLVTDPRHAAKIATESRNIL